jgi:peptidoglycan/xylan/chitin deacetylase (PgdA/CDA1 family)
MRTARTLLLSLLLFSTTTFGETLEHGPRSQPTVALTFDACAAKDATYDKEVIETLRREKVPATLFLSGRWMERFPKHTRALAKDPLFEIGVHGHRHRNPVLADDPKLEEEFSLPLTVLKELTGLTAKLYRAPFGILDARVVQAAEKHGLTAVQFDLASGDPDPKISEEKLATYVSTRAKNGSIVVLHMNGRGWQTAKALPKIISGLRARGFTFVHATQMRTEKPRKLAQAPRK